MKNKNIRYERKMHFTQLTTDQLETIIKLNPYGFKEIYEKRQVNSLYYDTDSWDSFYDNDLNATNRAKLRIRWYGNSLVMPNKNTRLEIKIKRGTVGDKLVKIKDYKSDQYLTYLLENTKPVLLVSYQREYFVSFDEKFRITLDYNLQYRNPNQNLQENPDYQDLGHVLEFKYGKNLDAQAKKIIEQFPGRVSKFSKYARGMLYLYS